MWKENHSRAMKIALLFLMVWDMINTLNGGLYGTRFVTDSQFFNHSAY